MATKRSGMGAINGTLRKLDSAIEKERKKAEQRKAKEKAKQAIESKRKELQKLKSKK